jgi:hypothetical protein
MNIIRRIGSVLLVSTATAAMPAVCQAAQSVTFTVDSMTTWQWIVYDNALWWRTINTLPGGNQFSDWHNV